MSKRTATFVTTALAAVMAGGAFAVGVAEPKLSVHLDGDYLRITAPRLSFLVGSALDRLRSGATVAFVGQLTVSSLPNAVVSDARSVARFALSYDIWEEKLSITRFGDRPEARRSINHLSAQAAERWCLDSMTIEYARLPAEKPFYVQFDLRLEDPRDPLGIVGDPGINITRLIEIFSRPVPVEGKKGQQARWLLNSGPYRLADLRKASHS
ncbi:MAG TPA: hypothetical protein VNH18_20780 [Bryobacteraceae bacterium]|nr:hypothetical protein [Bryobacteraceae bacterium]